MIAAPDPRTHANAPRYIHANAFVIGDFGLLLRGPSRSGKSTLTMALIAAAQMRGEFARLVGDDRVCVDAQDGALIARPHPRIAGLIEARGRGILAVPHAPTCTLRLIVDLAPGDGEAQPGDARAAPSVEIAGVELPRIVENAFSNAVSERILSWIQQLRIK